MALLGSDTVVVGYAGKMPALRGLSWAGFLWAALAVGLKPLTPGRIDRSTRSSSTFPWRTPPTSTGRIIVSIKAGVRSGFAEGFSRLNKMRQPERFVFGIRAGGAAAAQKSHFADNGIGGQPGDI